MSLLSPQMSLLVQPLTCPPAGVEAEFLVVALFLPGLVNVFEGLEGEDGGADFAGFAVPDEFDLAFVGEEEEAVFFRERLALLDELDEVALLGVGEVVVFGVEAGHGAGLFALGFLGRVWSRLVALGFFRFF